MLKHLTPIWKDEYKYLNYKYVIPFPDRTLFDQWTYDGYSNFNLNGEVFSFHGDPELPFTQGISDALIGWKDLGFNFFKMNTGDYLPPHADSFLKYKQLFNIKDISQIYRALIFLEDWKPGHYFEIDGLGIVNWKAGDYITWHGDTLHAAGNFGLEPRYTLQVTGHI